MAITQAAPPESSFVPVVSARKYIPQLDGYRAFAVLAVLLAHGFGLHDSIFFLRVVSQYGNLGVQLFFILSGYLITGILFDSKGSQGYFVKFFARRGLRIWPIYYAMVGLLFVALCWFSLKWRDDVFR